MGLGQCLSGVRAGGRGSVEHKAPGASRMRPAARVSDVDAKDPAYAFWRHKAAPQRGALHKCGFEEGRAPARPLLIFGRDKAAPQRGALQKSGFKVPRAKRPPSAYRSGLWLFQR